MSEAPNLDPQPSAVTPEVSDNEDPLFASFDAVPTAPAPEGEAGTCEQPEGEAFNQSEGVAESKPESNGDECKPEPFVNAKPAFVPAHIRLARIQDESYLDHAKRLNDEIPGIIGEITRCERTAADLRRENNGLQVWSSSTKAVYKQAATNAVDEKGKKIHVNEAERIAAADAHLAVNPDWVTVQARIKANEEAVSNNSTDMDYYRRIKEWGLVAIQLAIKLG